MRFLAWLLCDWQVVLSSRTGGQGDGRAEGEGRAELRDSDVIGEAGAVAAVLGVLKSVDKMETLQYCDEQQ